MSEPVEGQSSLGSRAVGLSKFMIFHEHSASKNALTFSIVAILIPEKIPNTSWVGVEDDGTGGCVSVACRA